MAFFNSYSPFVEAPSIRTTTQPVSGGIVIDISTAQGVSFRNPLLRQTTLLPQINSGRTDFVIEVSNFGFRPPNDAMSPYSDREKLTSEKYLQDPNQFGFPLFVGDFLPNDGAIEPLVIRDAAKLDSIEDPISHRIRGHLMCGNEDSYDGSDIKSSFILNKKNSDFVPFEDSVETMAGGTVSILGFVANSLEDKIEPFNDDILNSKRRFINKFTNINNSIVYDGLFGMTGSVDDDFRPLNSRSATSGFVYTNNSAGTDSLAFGGLLKG